MIHCYFIGDTDFNRFRISLSLFVYSPFISVVDITFIRSISAFPDMRIKSSMILGVCDEVLDCVFID